MLRLFGKKTGNTGQQPVRTYGIEFPYRARIENEEDDEDKYISGQEVFSYFCQDDLEGLEVSWNSSDMPQYIDDPALRTKIAEMPMTLLPGICHIDISVFEKLTDEERESILRFVSGQASDGWGEGDYDFIRNSVTGEMYFYWDDESKAKEENCISFAIQFWWNDGDWYIRYTDTE